MPENKTQQELDFERKHEQDLQRLRGLRLIDDDFMAALEAGMPPTAGIALGFDRLVMLCVDARRIEDVLWTPVAEPGRGRA